MKLNILLSFLTLVASINVQEEIYNTKKLIQLYQQKLTILQHIQSESPSLPKTPSFHEQPYFQLNISFPNSTTFVPPFYGVVGDQVYDLMEGKPLMKVLGTVICTDFYRITSLIHNRVNLLHFHEDKQEQLLGIRAKERKSIWHRRQEEDELVQTQKNVIYFYNERQERTLKMKSQVLCVFSVNQYKLLYVTRYHYGLVNVASLEIMTENQLPSIAEAAFKYQNMLFILLKNNMLLKIVGEVLVLQQKITSEIIPQNPQIIYFQSSLFIYSKVTPCYGQLIFENSAQSFKYPKKICIEEPTQNEYDFQFYQQGEDVKLLFWNSFVTKQYLLILPQKEQVKQFTFPYQIFLVIGIVVFILYRKNKKQRSNFEVDGRGRKRDRVINEIEDYLKKKRGKNNKIQ